MKTFAPDGAKSFTFRRLRGVSRPSDARPLGTGTTLPLLVARSLHEASFHRKRSSPYHWRPPADPGHRQGTNPKGTNSEFVQVICVTSQTYRIQSRVTHSILTHPNNLAPRTNPLLMIHVGQMVCLFARVKTVQRRGRSGPPFLDPLENSHFQNRTGTERAASSVPRTSLQRVASRRHQMRCVTSSSDTSGTFRTRPVPSSHREAPRGPVQGSVARSRVQSRGRDSQTSHQI